MKIIFICTKSITFNTFLKFQADYFIKKGFKVEVVSSDIINLNFKKNLNHEIHFPNKPLQFLNLLNYIKVFKQTKILVKKNPSAIFYLHTPVASHLFRLFNFTKNLKIIYFVHGFRFTAITNTFKAFFLKTIEKLLSFKTNIFITINNEDFNYAKSNFKYSYTHKVNGIGINFSSNLKKKKNKNLSSLKKILVISAYKKEKGYLDILKLAETLKNKKISIECFGYGKYGRFNSIKIKKKLHNIFFNNFDKNLHNKIKNFDILLHLSKREGLPVSVMESLLNGLPVICYNIRGNNDLIKHEYNGYFVRSYQDAVNKIIYLNLENKLLNKMRSNARKSMSKKFSRKNINLNLYNIIKNHSKRQQ